MIKPTMFMNPPCGDYWLVAPICELLNSYFTWFALALPLNVVNEAS
jgi:hypothetical protein